MNCPFLDDKMLDQLQAIGLTKNESLVYATLVQNGPSKAGFVITRLDIHRNATYEALDGLIRKGFVTRIKSRGVWVFQITDPDSLLSSIRRREDIAREVIAEIRTQHQQSQQQIVVYEGIESYRRYWLESLRRFPEGTVDYTVGVPPNDVWQQLMGKSLQPYLDLRAKKKIVWKTIHFSIEDSEREFLKKYPSITEYRLWPQPNSPIGNFNVIHDTVILQVMSESPRIIEIRDRGMVEVFKNYFDIMWAVAKPIS